MHTHAQGAKKATAPFGEDKGPKVMQRRLIRTSVGSKLRRLSKLLAYLSSPRAILSLARYYLSASSAQGFLDEFQFGQSTKNWPCADRGSWIETTFVVNGPWFVLVEIYWTAAEDLQMTCPWLTPLHSTRAGREKPLAQSVSAIGQGSGQSGKTSRLAYFVRIRPEESRSQGKGKGKARAGASVKAPGGAFPSCPPPVLPALPTLSLKQEETSEPQDMLLSA